MLGYPDMAAAADAVPALLMHRPLAVEGLDARLVDVVRAAKGRAAVPDLPRGAGWLMIEVGGETLDEERLRRVLWFATQPRSMRPSCRPARRQHHVADPCRRFRSGRAHARRS